MIRGTSTTASLLLIVFLNSHVAASDLIFVGNWGNNTIVKFDGKRKPVIFADSSSGLNQPQGLAFDAKENLYVGNSGNNTIVKIDPSGYGTLFAHCNSPSGLVFDSKGNLLASDAAGNRIWRFDSAGNSEIFADSSSGLKNPLGLAFNTNGDLFVANWAGDNILKFDSNRVATIFTSSVSNRPYGLAFDLNGNLFVSNDAMDTIQKFAPDGTPYYFANLRPRTNNLLWRIQSLPLVRKLFRTPPVRMHSPGGLAIDSEGNLYAPCFWNDNIAGIDKRGRVFLFSSKALKNPIYVAVRRGPSSSRLLWVIGLVIIVSIAFGTVILLRKPKDRHTSLQCPS